MKRILCLVAVASAVTCHGGEPTSWNASSEEELLGPWHDECTCVEFAAGSGGVGDCLSDAGVANPDAETGDGSAVAPTICRTWARMTENLVLFDDKKTVEAEIDAGVLDLYWDNDGGVQHMQLTRGCP